MHWNQIKPQGGLKIFQGLLENEGILVLDMSWNSIGGGNPSIVPIIAETLQKNEKIMHLDLSNNYFNLQVLLHYKSNLNLNIGLNFFGMI